MHIWKHSHQNWYISYLEAFTSELVYISAGPEFNEFEGHVLIISKTLYGLHSSGARWHDRFADCISELGFFLLKYPLFVLVFSRFRVKSTCNIGFNYVYVGTTYFYMVYLASSTKVLSWHSGKLKRRKCRPAVRVQQGALW